MILCVCVCLKKNGTMSGFFAGAALFFVGFETGCDDSFIYYSYVIYYRLGFSFVLGF
jgi:hypothetical protein